MTRKRLWVLYQLAGLIKAEIERLTGWSRGEIDHGLDKWHLRAWSSDSYWATNRVLENAVVRMIGADPAVTSHGQLDELRRGLKERLRAALLARPIDWTAIEALPWPEEVADAGASPRRP